MSFLRQLAGETFIYGSGHILPRVLQYIFFTPILTRILTTTDYGTLGLYYVFSGFLMILFTFRLETAFFRFGSEKVDREKYFNAALLFILSMSAVFILFFYIFRESVASLISQAEDQRLVLYSIIIIALDAIAAIPFARLRLEQKAKIFALLKILNVILIISATLFLLLGLGLLSRMGFNIPEYLLDYKYYLDYIFIGNIIGSLIITIILLFRYFSFRLKIDFATIKRMLKYSLPLIPVGIAGIINMTGDQWFITKLLPGTVNENIAQSGIYTAAKRVAIIMSLFTTAFNYAVEPFFFRNAKKTDAKSMYARTAEAYTIASCVIILSIIFYLDIFQYILGADFREGLFIVPIALFAFFFLGLYYNFSAWYKLTDKTIYGMYIALVGAAITIALNIILLPKYGYIGSSIAALICFFTMSVLCVYFGRRHYRIPYDFSKMVLYFILTIALIFLAMKTSEYFDLTVIYRIIFNTFLLLLFGIFIYVREKNGLLKM